MLKLLTMGCKMDKAYRNRKASMGFEWIRSTNSASSYLCPIGAVRDKHNASDDELRRLCVDESNNPHND